MDSVLPDGRLLGARSDVCAGVAAGVQIRPPDYAPFTRTLRVRLPADAATTDAYLDFLRQQIGKPYDLTAIAGYAVGRNWRDPGHWYCSELKAAALEVSRWLPWPLSNDVSQVDPGDLHLVVSARVDLRAIAA